MNKFYEGNATPDQSICIIFARDTLILYCDMKKLLRHKKKIWLAIPVIILVALGFTYSKDKEFEIIKNLDIFYSLFRELNLFYVDETQPKELIEAGIDGMLKSLDPYTTYIPEEEQKNFAFMTTGEYGGIGALIRRGGDYTIISEPYEGFPAQLSGLKAGDTILTINGISTRGIEISEVSELLKGTPGTAIKLELKRVGEKGIFEKDLIRKQITIPNVPYAGIVKEGIGYIRLTNFTRDAGKEAQEALKQVLDQGARSVIIDIRGNPGGLLIESVNVTNLFVRKGIEIVSTRGRVKQWDMTYKTVNQPVDTSIPVVVLVNRASASASEIVAGALQDLDRAVVMGQKTFGKGLVQTTRPLSYDAQLKVTTAKYYIPSGRCIQAVDYTHRNEDGSVGHIPDSLIREFRTAHGRKVYDGGGISPDIPVNEEQPGNITISLYTKNLIFDYATVYAAKHETFGSMDKIAFSDQDYEDFLNYIRNKDFDYVTESSNKLTELIGIARSERYYQVAEEEFEALKKKLAHDKEKDLQTFKGEIEDLIMEEIAGRYYFQKGKIRASLIDDKALEKAIEVCEDTELYKSLLTANNSKEHPSGN
jgi:carboxyl-terminal processing protease